MKNISGEFLIELGVLKNTQDIYNLRYGWDWSGGVLPPQDRQVGTETSWGLVFNEYDLRHTKLVLKHGIYFLPEPEHYMAVMSVKYGEERLYLYGVLVEDDNTISVAEVSVDPDDRTSHTVENRYKSVELDHEWGLVAEKEGMVFKAYAHCDEDNSPEDLVLEYEFKRRLWDTIALGVFGYNSGFRDILGFRRISMDNFNCLEDYEVTWHETDILEGWVRVNEKNLIKHSERGHYATIRLKGFEGETESDLYGNTSPAFSGLITDVEERNGGYEFYLKSFRHLLDKETDAVLLGDIEEIGDLSTLDYFTSLSYLYDHFLPPVNNFTSPDMSSSWHNSHDRVLTIKGSALDAEQEHLEFGGMGVRVQPVQEMTAVDVEVYEVGSGKDRVVKDAHTAESQSENIKLDFDIKNYSREDVYTNLIKQTGSADDEDRWIVRSNRFDRLLNRELELDIEKEMDLSDFPGDIDDFVGVAKDYIEMQIDGYFGDITLPGHHHDLAGLYKSGNLIITDSDRDIWEERCRVAGFTINRGNTEIEFTQSPLMSRKEQIDKIQESMTYQDVESVYDACSETKLLVWADQPIKMDAENITEIEFLEWVYPGDYEPITEKIEVETDVFRGYVYIDIKLTPEHFLDEAKNARTIQFYGKGQQEREGIFADNRVQLSDFERYGYWFLNGDLDGDDVESEIHVTIGIMQDLIVEIPRETTFTFGEPKGGWGDPDAGGGHFGKPKSKTRMEEYD